MGQPQVSLMLRVELNSLFFLFSTIYNYTCDGCCMHAISIIISRHWSNGRSVCAQPFVLYNEVSIVQNIHYQRFHLSYFDTIHMVWWVWPVTHAVINIITGHCLDKSRITTDKCSLELSFKLS